MNLAAGVAALNLALPAGAEDKLAAYLALLLKWNKVYNLTAIRDPQEMVTHHLLDSLSVLPTLDTWQKSALAGRRFTLADVGSGAGLPGLVLAIARPDWSIISIEAVDKKAAFQRQAKIELGLANVDIRCGRVEEVRDNFDAVISRAFASLADFVGFAGHLAPCLWAMKGVYPADELAHLPSGWQQAASEELSVPGLGAQRHLLRLERV
jgi:16S rRNA (guanine527-N7)-methyltransferase